MIRFGNKGDFSKTIGFLKSLEVKRLYSKLDKYGQEGVAALSAATPVRTGKTAASWTYTISIDQNGAKIEWHNLNLTTLGVPVAILIQYGHSANGHFVQGRDFINPAIQPIFDEIAEKVWQEVKMS